MPDIFWWAMLFFALMALLLQKHEFKCPRCDFHSPSEEEANKHIAWHARHKPKKVEIYT